MFPGASPREVRFTVTAAADGPPRLRPSAARTFAWTEEAGDACATPVLAQERRRGRLRATAVDDGRLRAIGAWRTGGEAGVAASRPDAHVSPVVDALASRSRGRAEGGRRRVRSFLRSEPNRAFSTGPRAP